MNLIDTKNYFDNNCYFCTWLTQNLGRSAEEQLSNTKQTRDYLNEESVFGKNGTASVYSKIKSNLLFVIDDGWDVTYNLNMGRNRDQFGSLIVNDERFPSCTGTPAERLEKLSNLVKKAGWKGLGIWICSNACGETVHERLNPDDSRQYWRERMLWCKEAGVTYWKVDWGHYERSETFRRMLDEIASDVYPELVIEHAGCVQALNGVEINNPNSNDSGLFMEWNNEHSHWLDILRFSKVFRTYDILNQLSIPTTLDRVYNTLRIGYENDTANCVLNCEDEMYIGAVLGLNLGIMRSELWQPLEPEVWDPTKFRYRTTEVNRAMNWLLYFAPPMGVNEATVAASEEWLTESHYCDERIFAGKYTGKTVKQSAPAVITRGCVAPKVKYIESEKPFIIAARNKTGAYSIAALYRKLGQDKYRTPLAETTLFIDNPNAPVGIFGYHDKIILKYPLPVNSYRVFMQDLASDTAEDITKFVDISGNRVLIDGDIISRIGKTANKGKDISEPGVVVKLVCEK